MRTSMLLLALVALASPADAGVFPGGKKAAFCLSFDDGCASQFRNVFPRLAEYRIHGTFYVCPGWTLFREHEAEWATTNRYVHLGNHTMTHGAVTNLTVLAKEVDDCNREIVRVGWDKEWPRRIAWGIPGTETMQKLVPGVTDAQVRQFYADHHLVERLPYHGYPVACRTIPEMESYIDALVATGGVGHLDFHGVGGDWLDPGLEYFDAMLRKLDSCREHLWFAPWPEIHKVMGLGE